MKREDHEELSIVNEFLEATRPTGGRYKSVHTPAAARREIQKFKGSTPCMDCSRIYPYYVMDFDHRAEKQWEISDMTRTKGLTYEDVQAELAKCDLVCANCHRERTFGP